MFVFCKNLFRLGGSSTVAAPAASVKEILLKYPNGVYTTARCAKGNLMVFELQSHLDRIIQGMQNLFPEAYKKLDTSVGTTNSPSTKEILETYLKLHMQTVAQEFDGDSRLTLLAALVQDSDNSMAEDIKALANHPSIPKVFTTSNGVELAIPFEIYCMGEALPAAPKAGIPVVVRYYARKNPEIKDAQFVSDRQVFERSKGVCNESLLVEDDKILEGCSSNFFALYSDNTLRTAGEGVLIGTVRNLVLDVAGKSGLEMIKSDLNPPKLSEIAQWKACFITSTSRLVLPIAKVIVPDAEAEKSEVMNVTSLNTGEKQKVFEFDIEGTEILGLMKAVEDQILVKSTSIAGKLGN